MAFQNVIALIDQKLPDNGGADITPADLRQVLASVAVLAMGVGDLTYSFGTTSNTITNAQLIGKTVSAILGDGFTKLPSSFSKPLNSDTITFTDGSSFPAGTEVTIYYS